jgi:hypothetical protein
MPAEPTDRYQALVMTERWVKAFEVNKEQRPEIAWDAPLSAAPFPRDALLKSLATFQLGESGQGDHIRRRAERQHHPAYADAIDMFVAEEQRHAWLLAEVLGRFGHRCARRTGPTRCSSSCVTWRDCAPNCSC